MDDALLLLLEGQGALAADVARHGHHAVGEAVRSAYVSLYSRAFNLEDESSSGQALVPLLDALQHSARLNSLISSSQFRCLGQRSSPLRALQR